MSKAKLTGMIVPVSDLREETVDTLFHLFQRHYLNVTNEGFKRDLHEKEWIILLRDSQYENIRGFSTLTVMHVAVDDVLIAVAFSGDTIIDREYWGEQQLVRSWYQLMERLRIKCDPMKLYWFLISKGYRTYLYLPTFFKDFYPRYDYNTPQFEQNLIDTLGPLKYPHSFNPKTGVIEFNEPEGNLTDELAQVPARRLRDPNVKFFLKRNPGYVKGNELVCVAEFSPDNLRPLTRRLVGETPARTRG